MNNANKFSFNAFLNSYKGVRKEKNNMIMSTLIANFQTKFGLKNKGVDIITNIINNVPEDTTCLIERNILIWNIYILIDEYIESGQYDMAKKLIEKGKRSFSRSAILGDTVGNFHISWIEQMFLKEAKLNLKTGRNDLVEKICREVIDMREDVRRNAIIINEIIDVDRCKATSYRYLSIIYSGKRKELSMDYIKKAIYYKCLNKNDYVSYIKQYSEIETNSNSKNSYSYLVKSYLNEKKPSYDNIKYSYCISCLYNKNNMCEKHNLKIDNNMSCEVYKVDMLRKNSI